MKEALDSFLTFAERHELLATLWVFALALPLCCRPFTLVTVVRTGCDHGEDDAGSDECG